MVLNGVPRSGKSSIARALQDAASPETPWLNLGVDTLAAALPEELRPGIGLRPGGERPDLEESVVALFDLLYATVAAWSRTGLNVVVDVGHHDDFSRSRGILGRVASEMVALPAYFVGVRCSFETIMSRRAATPSGPFGLGGGASGAGGTAGPVTPDLAQRWERAVHDPGLYDVEVDTSRLSPDACAAAILRRIAEAPPAAFAALAGAGSGARARPRR